MRVREVADLVGISIRTLHHYDAIGLLTPDEKTEAGYRVYSHANLALLQQILFYKELGFPLEGIKEMVNNPEFDRQAALQVQRKMLMEKRDQLDQLIVTMERTIQHTRGEIQMTNKEKFEGFDFSHNPYEQEARERWGDQAVDAANTKVGEISKDEQAALSAGMNELFTKLAVLRQSPPDSEEAQAVMKEWYRMLNRIGSYSLEGFKGLGQMYVEDRRFTKNMDKFGEGLAAFMRDAMAIYADNNTEDE